MRFRRSQIVRPTLMFSAAGVMVDTYEDHLFADTSPPMVVGQYREVDPPPGSAVCAVQFVHVLGQLFDALQVFRLHYYLPQSPSGLLEAYLAPVHEELKMRAVANGAESLSRDQKRVLCTLLVRSDPKAWEASPAFRQLLER